MTQGNSEKKSPARSGKGGRKKTGTKPRPKGAPSSPGTKKAPGKKATEPSHPFLTAMAGIFFLMVIVVGTGWFVHDVFPPDEQAEKPAYEIFPTEDATPKEPVGKKILPFPDRPSPLPEVAIIIDDIGYNRSLARKFIDLDIDLTFSVLPRSPHAREIAADAHGKGVQVMLHLPMEPQEYPRVDPGPGALLMSMDVDEMIDLLYDHLETVPYVVGVNNHMGSRMTAVSTRMYQIFTVLKKMDLFFIDSRTSSQSLCKPSARLLQISFGERDVFLDHSLDKETIRKQLRTLIHVAQRNGQAIGIGHPHSVTYEVIAEELPIFRKKVRLVHASKLVKPLG